MAILKKTKNWFSIPIIALKCRSKVLQNHSATLSTFIELPFVIKIVKLSIFEWPVYTLSGFTAVLCVLSGLKNQLYMQLYFIVLLMSCGIT